MNREVQAQPISSQPKSGISIKKKFCFSCVVFVVFVGVLEFVSGVVLGFMLTGSHTIESEVQAIATGARHTSNAAESIHPYLGWVLNPELHPGTELFENSVPVNSLGFNDYESVLSDREANDFVVGIAGGSVAWQVSVEGEQAIKDGLSKSAICAGKRIRIVRIAMSGYKQPQQLMALNYLLSLGFDFDAVINLDGYNEIALTACENVDSGVAIAYPRMWQARMLDIVDPRVYSQSYQLLKARAERQQLARDRLDSRFPQSQLLNLLWYLRDRRYTSEIAEVGSRLLQHKTKQGMGFGALGPGAARIDGAYPIRDMIDLWKRSSLQMHRVCEANGIVYLHGIQPNQYHEGSKPLTRVEREELVDPLQCYGQRVAECYPLLIQAGKELTEQGVEFVDTSMLFQSVDEQIYQDYFCHYNARGNRIVASALAQELVDRLEAGSDHSRE